MHWLIHAPAINKKQSKFHVDFKNLDACNWASVLSRVKKYLKTNGDEGCIHNYWTLYILICNIIYIRVH